MHQMIYDPVNVAAVAAAVAADDNDDDDDCSYFTILFNYFIHICLATV